MKRRMAVGPGQPEKDVVSVEVASAKEVWNEYVLEDGTIFKAKIVLAEMWRIEGEWDAEGNPIYFMKAAIVPSASPAESLKRARPQPAESGEHPVQEKKDGP